MLQFPDFDEKQILFIESFDQKNISFQNENLIIKEYWKIKNKVSLYKIFTIFLIWETTITSVLIRKFQEFGVTLILLKNIREKPSFIKDDILKIKGIILKIKSVKNYESLLWYEWNVAKLFFWNYFWPIGWQRREPRTKRDIQNLLLDIGYTYLFHFIEALLRLYWFDNYYWVYHRTWYSRKSLALDLMEPFRCIIDRELLKAYNLKQINTSDFKFQNWAYVLPWKNSQKYSSIFLKAIMNNKEDMFFFIKNYYKYFMKGREEFPKFEI